MLKVPGQPAMYIIIDALDECPNISGMPTAREEVLEFLEDLVKLNFRMYTYVSLVARRSTFETLLNPWRRSVCPSTMKADKSRYFLIHQRGRAL
jgi:hypothetical protein